MKPTFIVVLSLLAVSSQVSAEEYSITVESGGREIAVIELSIDGDIAIATVADVTDRFDLKNQRWQHTETKQWVSMSQCEAWAEQSREKSSKSTASLAEELRPWMTWALNPTFEVKATDTTVSMTSGRIDYEITAKKTDRDVTGFFRYARLNAYKKAMNEGTLPPFAELTLLEELERREMMPTVMEIRVPGLAGVPTLKMAIDVK